MPQNFSQVIPDLLGEIDVTEDRLAADVLQSATIENIKTMSGNSY